LSRSVVLKKKSADISVDILGLSWIFCGVSDFVDFCGFFKVLTWIFHSGKTATLSKATKICHFREIIVVLAW